MARRFLLPLVASSVLGWGCVETRGADPGGGPRPGALQVVDGAEVDEDGGVWVRFDAQPVGEGRSVSVSLRNDSDHDLALSWTDLELPFVLEAAPARVRKGRSTKVGFLFRPTEAGGFGQVVELRTPLGSIPFHLVGEGIEGSETCELRASSSSLRFAVGPGEPALTREGRVRLTASEGGPCQVDAIETEGHPSFSVSTSFPMVLQPGASTGVPVRFTPAEDADEAEGALIVRTDDGTELRVALGTKSENECLWTDEEWRPLDVMGAGCGPGLFEVHNRCDHDVEIASGGTTGGFFAHVSSAWRLGPDDAAVVRVEFAPGGPPWIRAGELIVGGANGDRIRRQLMGSFTWRDEVFEARPEQTFDLLIVLDVGEGLAAYQEELDRFAQQLLHAMKTTWDTEYRVHVTTTSMVADGICEGEAGKLVPLDGSRPTTVTWDTPNRDEALLANLRAPACASEGGQGLAAIEAALGDGWPAWRKGPLTVVVWSVDDDASAEDVEHYRELFGRKIGGGARYVDALTLFLPTDGCGEEPPPRYLDLGQGHSVFPICERFHLPVDPPPFSTRLAATPVDLDGVPPINAQDGVEVRVDGNVLERDWEVFDGVLTIRARGSDRVEPGSRIEIRYPVSCR